MTVKDETVRFVGIYQICVHPAPIPHHRFAELLLKEKPPQKRTSLLIRRILLISLVPALHYRFAELRPTEKPRQTKKREEFLLPIKDASSVWFFG